MIIPLRSTPVVYHVGTLKPEDRGHFMSESHEGNLLSVSTCPKAWQQIARIGGSPTHAMTRADGKPLVFLDMHALSTAANKELREHIIAYCLAAGFATREQKWRMWSTDEDGEWRYGLFDTRDKAVSECEMMDDEDPTKMRSCKGHFMVEPVDDFAPTPALQDLLHHQLDGMPLVPEMISAWAQTVLMPAMPEIIGLWWNDTFDPWGYSAPRGGILPARIPDLITTLVPENAVRYQPTVLKRVKKDLPDHLATIPVTHDHQVRSEVGLLDPSDEAERMDYIVS